ncbi:MAG: right-handed parallel beta-helix repeat-containing protein [Elusimicrobiota bacterium]
MLVLWLITALFRSRTTGFITALVFLLHPAQVESVAWISALANPLFLTTYLLAALFFLRALDTGSKTYYPLSAFCFVLSLLSKEMAVTLPMLMAVIVMLRRRDGQKAAYLPVALYGAGAGGFAVLRSLVLGQTAQTGYWAGSFYFQALTMLKGFAYYVKLALAPYPLSLEYLWPAKQGLDAETAFYALLLGSLLALGVKLLRRAPKAGVGILLFAGALAPVSNLIPLTTIINERFMYLSLIGWGLIVSEILEHSGRARAAALVAVCLAYAGITIDRNRDWRDAESLVTASLKTCPQSSRLHAALGKVRVAERDWDGAAAAYRQALAIEVLGDAERGAVHAVEPWAAGLLTRAADYRRVVQVRVDRGETYFQLGTIHIHRGDYAKAEGYLELALKHRPTDAKVMHNIAVARELAAEEFMPRLRREYPGLESTWSKLAALNYERSGRSILPGSAAQGRNPQEREALRALAARGAPAFPNTFGRAYTVRAGDAAVEVRHAQGRGVTAQVGGGAIQYPEAYPETTVFIAAGEGGIEEFYYLKSPRAPKTFTQELTPRGRIKSFRLDPAGRLEAVDAADRTVFQLSRPVVFDAAGKRRQGRFELKRGKRTSLAMKIDDRGLRYPLLIDPAWTTAGASNMNSVRQAATATLLPNGTVLVAGGMDGGPTPIGTAEIYDPFAGTWRTTGNMATARVNHGAVLLPSGKVLVFGGQDQVYAVLSSSELYDPDSGTFSSAGSMTTARVIPSAVLLQDGRVLVAGGWNAGTLSTAEVYVASDTPKWQSTAPMGSMRYDHTLTSLPDGTVLAAGGEDGGGNTVNTAEVYSPFLNNWNPALNTMSAAVRSHAATLAPNGKVVITGGRIQPAGTDRNTCDLFDPSTQLFAPCGGNMTRTHSTHSSVLLPNGRILIAGGDSGDGGGSASQIYDPVGDSWALEVNLSNGARTSAVSVLLPSGKVLIAGGTGNATTDLYDPDTGSWVGAGNFTDNARYDHSATLLPNGKVLIAGGYNGANPVNKCQLYTPGGGWASTGNLNTARDHHTATLLVDGTVLVAGGFGAGNTILSSVEIYDPGSGTWAPADPMSTSRAYHTATLLANGEVLVVGGVAIFGPNPSLETAEIYAGGGWRPTASLMAASKRQQHTATLLTDGTVLVAGGLENQFFSIYNDAFIFDPDSESWSSAPGILTARYGHSATLLPDGRVLVFGGENTPVNDTDIYTPGVAWTSYNWGTERRGHTATLLPDGKLAVIGGNFSGPTLNDVSVYAPGTSVWTTMPTLTANREYHTATLLPNGRILVAGGFGGAAALSSTELALYTEYDHAAAGVDHMRPVIDEIAGNASFPVWLTTGTYVITGSTFTGGSAADSGHQHDSPGGHPRLLLMPMGADGSNHRGGGGRFIDLTHRIYGTAEETYYKNGQADDTLKFTIDPSSIACGYYQLRVIANAAPSDARIVRITDPVIDGAPGSISPPYAQVRTTTAAVDWGLLAVTPDYYRLHASTAADYTGAWDVITGTDSAASSGDLEGLYPNTTYYFRVAGVNCAGTGPYYEPASTSTLANRVRGVEMKGVFLTSATFTWQKLPTAAQEGSTSTAEGYILQASDAEDFSTTIYSAQTPLIGLSTLTVTGLNAGTTYYFRVGSLNWNSVGNFASTIAARTDGWYEEFVTGETDQSMGAAWGDLDNDGDLDFVAVNQGTFVQVYRNDGGGSFSLPWDSNAEGAKSNYAVSLGDYDNDGDLDIAIGRANEANVVFRNNGNFNFGSAPVWSSSEADDTEGIAWGDYNNDGYLDLLAANLTANRVYRNNGDGTFTLVWTDSESENTNDAAWADYDGDGDLDFAVACEDCASRVYRNDGADTFTPVWNDGSPGGAGRSPAWGDVDNDGRLDLAFGYRSAANRVFRQNGTDSFGEIWNDGRSDDSVSVALGDFNNDGLLDLASGNYAEANRIYVNNGDQSFSSIWFSAVANNTESIAWGDYNGDGGLDLLASNRSQSNRVYRGSFSVVNTSPTAPGGIAAVFDGDIMQSTLTIKWDASDYDANGSTESVYYAVALTTIPMMLSPDNRRILKPAAGNVSSFTISGVEASPLLGKYLRPAYQVWPGDAVPKHGVMISTTPNLPNGWLLSETTYYVRIQAIDAGLARSTWSREVEFRTGKICGTMTSLQSGDWSDHDTWVGSGDMVPNDCTEVTIAGGHTVVVDTQSAVASTTTIEGTLKFSRVTHSTLTIVGGDITVEPGGHLDMGTGDDSIDASSASLVLAYGSVAGEFGLIIKDGGDFTVFGATRTSVADLGGIFINPWSTNFQVGVASSTGWKPGDMIVLGPTSGFGQAVATSHTITNVGPGDPRMIMFEPNTGPQIRVGYSTKPVIAANISRNVIIRSSGTDTTANSAYVESLVSNTTSFSVFYGEFAYLGAEGDPTWGIKLQNGSQAQISSSSIRNCRYGLYANNVDNLTFTDNVAYGNAANGFTLYGGNNNIYRGNVAAGNDSVGFYIGGSFTENVFEKNYSFANNLHGFYLDSGGSIGNLLQDNLSFGNGQHGFTLNYADRNILLNNHVYENDGTGFYVSNESDLNTFQGNSVSANKSANGLGFRIDNSWANLLVDNQIYMNESTGVYILNGASGTVISSGSVYGNGGYGYALKNSVGNQIVNGSVGLPQSNAAGVLYIDPDANPETLVAKAVKSDDGPLSTAAFNNSGTYLITYDVDASSSSVGFNGEYTISGETWNIDYNQRLYASTATTPRLMRGSGHSAAICALSDTNAVTQYVYAAYNGANWDLYGSQDGFMGSVAGGLCLDPGAGQFSIDITEAAPAPGDRIDFLMQAASGDVNRDKSLWIGPSAAGYNQGRSKLVVAPDGGIVFRGNSSTYTIINWMDNNTTYYSLVSSGAFTAEYTSFTNLDHNGLQLSGNQGVVLSTVSFDRLGFWDGVNSGTNTYITLRDLTAAATFYGVQFGMSRSSTGFDSAYNVRVEAPHDNLDVYFAGVATNSGVYWGEGYEDDANGRVTWNDLICMPHVSNQSGNWTDPLTWDPPYVPQACTTVTIMTGDTVTVDTTTATASTTTIAGTLRFSRVAASTLTMVGGDLTVANGGHLDMGMGGDQIATTSATLVLAYGQAAGQFGLIVENGGRFTVFGATKVPAYTPSSSQIPTGSNYMTINVPGLTGWKTGDIIAIAPTSGSGPAAIATHTITQLGTPAPNDMFFTPGVGATRVNTSTAPIIVTNLSRTVLIRSSGTDTGANTAYIRNLSETAGDFYAYYGEFAYLGASASGKYGITFNGGPVKGGISSSTIRDGYHGIYLFSADGNTFTDNLIYNSAAIGLYGASSSNNAIANNHILGGDSYGTYLTQSDGNTLSGNMVYANGNSGIYLLDSDDNGIAGGRLFANSGSGLYSSYSANNDFDSVAAYGNTANGVMLNGASSHTVTAGSFYGNNFYGIYAGGGSNYNRVQDNEAFANNSGLVFSAAADNVVSSNVFRGNADRGIWLDGSDNNVFAHSISSGNSGYAVYLENASDGNFFIEGHYYSNPGGVYTSNSSSNVFAGGALGYSETGADRWNSPSGEVDFDAAAGKKDKLTLKDVRVNSMMGISSWGLNESGESLLSYDQDDATGTLRLYGDYELLGSTWTFDTSLNLYAATHTAARLMRGSGHQIYNIAPQDIGAVNEVISVEWMGTDWRVEGSASGVLDGGFWCPAGNTCGFTDPVVDFTLNPAGVINVGDRFDFALIAASKDAGFQKRLLFANASWQAGAFNEGKSRLVVAPDGGIVFKGAAGSHAIMDRLNAASTYYTFVDSGAFTAAFSSFTNMDYSGLQLSGDKGIAISSTVFDYLGFATATNAYITVRDLDSAVTIDSVTFALSRGLPGGTNASYNIRVEGDDSNLAWTITTQNLGPLWGDTYDDDAGRRVAWRHCNGVVSSQNGDWSDPTMWDGGFVPTVCNAVTIAGGHAVVVDEMGAIAKGLAIDGTLSASRAVSSSLTITAGDLNLSPGGTLDYGTEASPVPTGVDAHVVLAYGSSAGEYGLIVNNTAKFTVRGSTRTPFALATQSATGGQTQVRVPSVDAVGWVAGDRLALGPTDGDGEGLTEEFFIQSIDAGNPRTVTLSGSVGATRVRTSTTPIVVANLTRNVLVRSSGTDTAANTAYIQNLTQSPGDFVLDYGEFAYLGANAADKQGIKFMSSGVEGRISSSTIRGGYYGIYVNVGSSHKLAYNVLYDNAASGIYAINMAGSTVAYNSVMENGQHGIYLFNSTGGDDMLQANMVFANGDDGIRLSKGFEHRLRENYAFSNLNDGIEVDRIYDSEFSSNTAHSNGGRGLYLVDFGSNTLTGNIAYRNASSGTVLSTADLNVFEDNSAHGNFGAGFYLSNSDNNTFIRNEAYANTTGEGHGFNLQNSERNVFAGNTSHSNAGDGVRLYSGDYNRFAGARIYNNAGDGIWYSQTSDAEFGDAWLGYDAEGADRPDGGAEVQLDPASPPGAIVDLRSSRVNPASGISTSGFNDQLKLLVSWNQDYDTGTLRLFGHVPLDDTLTIGYADALTGPTTTQARLTRGSGNFLTVCSIDAASAVSQIVYATKVGANWEVRGSSSGYMGIAAVASCPGTDFGQFRLSVTESAPSEGDRMDLLLLAGTNDANRQKRLLMGPADPAYNEGRSKFEVQPGGGLVLSGQPGYPTIMDRIDSGATYYSFVSSGSFTAVNSSITNVDYNGVWLSGAGPVVIATSTFDQMGVAAAVNSYITANELSGGATFYNVKFGSARSTEGVTAYNVRSVGASTPDWYFRRWHGDMGGEDYDSDSGEIKWTDLMPSPPTNVAAVQTGSSVTLKVSWGGSERDGPSFRLVSGSEYYIQWSTETPDSVDWSTANAQVVQATGPVNSVSVSHTIGGLPAGKTVYLGIWSRDELGRYSRRSGLGSGFSAPFTSDVLASGLGAGSDEHDMAVDKDGNVHVVYDDGIAGQVKYVKRTGSVWSAPVNVGPLAGGTPPRPAVAVDINGNPHIVWAETSSKVSYSSSTDGGATFTTADEIYPYGAKTHDLALDGRGSPHVIFYNGGLQYTKNSTGAWTQGESISGVSNSSPSLVLDGDGRPHIIYMDGLNLMYASRTSSGWNKISIYSDSASSQNGSLVIDGAGRPHVAYAAQDTGNLLHLYYDGGSWNSFVVDVGGSPGMPSLTLDGDGYPHIAYMANTPGDLKYAYYDGASWSTMTVASDGNIGFVPVIALDGNANVNISYLDLEADRSLHISSWTATGFAVPMGGNPRGKVQAPTGMTATQVYIASATWNWQDNSANEVGYRLYASSYGRVDAAFSLRVDSNTMGPGTVSATLTDLTPDTTYEHYVAAVSEGGTVTSTAAWINTLADHPSAAAVPVAAIYPASMTVSWQTGANPAYTEYAVRATTAADFSGGFKYPPGGAGWIVDASTEIVGISEVNATYYIQVAARNLSGVETPYILTVTTPSLANLPATTGNDFSAVSSHSLTVTWSANGNPANTLYRVMLATSSPFSSSLQVSTAPSGALSTDFAGLRGNTTYYLAVEAFNHAGVGTGDTILSSTITRIAPPTQVFFDRISSDTIVASAYAPTPAFNNLHAGRSATAIRLDGGGYANWRGSTWTLLSPLAAGGRSMLGGGAIDGTVYAVGGDNGGYLDRTEAYDPGGDSWGSTNVLNTSRRAAGLAVADGKLYAIGGFNGAFLNSAEVYDPDTNSWTFADTMPSNRAAIAAAALNGRIYAVGGLTGGTEQATNQEYDPAADQWAGANKTAMTQARAYAVAVGTFGKVYVFGGSDGGQTTLYDDVEAYDPVGNGWTSGAPMPTSRHGMAAGAIGGKIVVVGGEDMGGVVALNEEYDARADSWAAREPMLTTRAFAGSTVVDGRLYVFGGHDGSPRDVVEKYDPGVTQKFTGLNPNSFHQFRAKARNSAGTESSETALFSIYTLAAVPSTATPSFQTVFPTSATFQWTSNGNTGGATDYRAEASSAPSFSGTLYAMGWTVALSTGFTGLAGNSTYYFRVQARNGDGVETAFKDLGSTVTAANPPLAPVAAQVEKSSAIFEWSANGNADGTGYVAQLALNESFAPVDRSSFTRSTYAIFGASGLGADLALNTTYYFRVQAVNRRGAPTIFTSTISARTLVEAPGTAAEPFPVVGADAIEFAWGDGGNPAGTLYEADISTDNFATLNLTSATYSTSTLFGAGGEGLALLTNATHYFRVRALNSSGNPTVNTAVVSTPTWATLPLSAAAPFPNVDLSSMTYEWNPDANKPGTLYRVLLSTDDFSTVNLSSWTRGVSVLFGTGGEGQALDQNTTYYFKVNAVSHAGLETGTLQESTHTRAAIPAAGAPVFSDVQVGSVTFNWGENSNPSGLTDYYVEVGTAADFATLTFVSSTTATALQAGAGGIGPTLDLNTTYYFRVRARDLGGTYTLYGAEQSTATLAAGPVGGSFADIGVSSAVFQWTGPDPAYTLYEAQVSTDAFATVSLTSATRETAAVFGTTGEGAALDPSTTHYFRVRAVNRDGIPTLYAFTASTHTLAAVPASAASAFTALHHSSMTAAWNANSNGAGTVYEAVLSTGSGGVQGYAGDQTVSTHPAGAPTADITGLVANTTYYLYVRAVNPDGWRSDYAVLGSTPTLPNDPAAAAPPFFAVHFTSATVNWDENGNQTGTLYSVALSTGSSYPNGYSGSVEISTTHAAAQPTATLTGLSANATYYLHVAAFGRSGARTAYLNSGSSVTAALPPVTAASTFSSVAATSLTGVWEANGNIPGTLFEAIVSTGSGLPSSFAGDVEVSTRPEGTPAADFAALTPNSTYYLIARTIGHDGTSTSYAAFGSTVTPAALPVAAVPAFSSGSTTGLVGDWGANGNPPDDTRYETVLSTASSLVLTAAGNVPVSTAPAGAPSAEYTSLEVNTTYYLFVRSVDRLGRATAFAAVGSSATQANAPSTVLVSTPFAQVDYNAIRYVWDANGNPDGTVYTAEMALDASFALVDRSSVTVGTEVIFGNQGAGADLTFQTTYYFRVRAENVRGVPTDYTTVQSTVTLPDDIIPPTMTNNQLGDGVWRRDGATLYDLDVFDTGGRHLNRIEVKASVNPGGGGPDLFSFTPVQTNLATFVDAFTNDWSLSTVFDLLADDVTNYITVRVYDGIGNSSTTIDAFYVLKDTSPPVYINNEAGGDSQARFTAGTAYDVDAVDPGSGLAAFQYSASTVATSADGGRVPWTDIATLTPGATEYRTDWQVDFAALLEGTTNYVSVRSWNVSGVTSTVVDAFHVIKDTSGPIIGITHPSAGFLPSLDSISGTAYDLIGVQGTELNVRIVSGNYWDPGGPAFSAGAAVWMPATGTTDWTLAPGIPWADGVEYQIVARSSDSAGNYTVTYATVTFTLDSATPTVSIGLPVPDSTISSLPLITGTAADPGGNPSGLQAVGVRVRNLADGTWWNFVTETWSGTAVTEIASGLTSWSVTPSELLKANLKDQTSYFVAVQASDNAAPPNQTEFMVGGATFTFSDTTPPAAIADLDASSGTEPGDILLTWTATGDDGAVGTILLGEYRIHYSTDAGVGFSTTNAQVVFSTAVVAPGAGQARLLVGLSEGLAADTTYYLRVFLQDDAGNWSPLSNGATVQSAPSPLSQIKGHVVTASSQGITAVSIAAYDASGVLVSTALTVADGSGTYVLGGLPPANYRVEATWEANEIISSVWLDGIPVGTTLIDFVLEINYTLSTMQGSLNALSMGAASSNFAAAAADNNFGTSRVELFQRGKVVAQTGIQPTGRWSIAHLLPGKYYVRAFNGLEYTKQKEVILLEGEVQDVSFVFDPLNEDAVFAFPNPARDGATIRFVTALLPLEAQVRIFDIAGTLVREIVGLDMESPSPALYHAKWDLKNMDGDDVASGVYIFIVKVKGANGQSAKVVKKIAVVR